MRQADHDDEHEGTDDHDVTDQGRDWKNKHRQNN